MVRGCEEVRHRAFEDDDSGRGVVGEFADQPLELGYEHAVQQVQGRVIQRDGEHAVVADDVQSCG
jgi:hypothetical protein